MTIEELRKVVAARLSLPSFDVPADLSPQNRERLYDGMADYIIENYDLFDRTARDWASRRIDSPIFKQPLESYGVGDAVKSFGGEFIEQGRKIVTLENPFVRYGLLGLAIGAGLYLTFKADKASRIVKGA